MPSPRVPRPLTQGWEPRLYPALYAAEAMAALGLSGIPTTHGNCYGRGDVMVPEYTGRRQVKAIEEAKAVCRGCPILIECRDLGVETVKLSSRGQAYGVWGGLAPAELDALAGARDAA